MKRGSTLFLKSAVSLIGIAVLAFCIFILPNGIRVTHWDGYRPLLVGMYVTAVPFFFALYQTMKLLNYIDTNKAFSLASITALRYIMYCGILLGVFYCVEMPYIYSLARQDDAPGVVIIGIVFTFAPFIVAVISAVLQKLLQDAITMKSENELTV